LKLATIRLRANISVVNPGLNPGFGVLRFGLRTGQIEEKMKMGTLKMQLRRIHRGTTQPRGSISLSYFNGDWRVTNIAISIVNSIPHGRWIKIAT
jgi:hypothetical protein